MVIRVTGRWWSCVLSFKFTCRIAYSLPGPRTCQRQPDRMAPAGRPLTHPWSSYSLAVDSNAEWSRTNVPSRRRCPALEDQACCWSSKGERSDSKSVNASRFTQRGYRATNNPCLIKINYHPLLSGSEAGTRGQPERQVSCRANVPHSFPRPIIIAMPALPALSSSYNNTRDSTSSRRDPACDLLGSLWGLA